MKLGKFAKYVAGIGLPALAYGVGSTLATDAMRVPEEVKAGGKAIVGALAGLAMAERAPKIAAGFAIGGMVSGGEQLAKALRLRYRLANLMTPQQANSNSSNSSSNSSSSSSNSSTPNGGTAPGGRVYNRAAAGASR